MDDFEDVYHTLTGEILPEYALPGVENAFAPGQPCRAAEDRLYQARDRILARLGVSGEDEDLEQMLGAFYEMQIYLCREMYRLGRRAGIAPPAAQ